MSMKVKYFYRAAYVGLAFSMLAELRTGPGENVLPWFGLLAISLTFIAATFYIEGTRNVLGKGKAAIADGTSLTEEEAETVRAFRVPQWAIRLTITVDLLSVFYFYQAFNALEAGKLDWSLTHLTTIVLLYLLVQLTALSRVIETTVLVLLLVFLSLICMAGLDWPGAVVVLPSLYLIAFLIVLAKRGFLQK